MNTPSRAWLAAALMLGLPVVPGVANSAEDPPTRHNMLVVGKERAFLSHLPMFEAVNEAGTDYVSRHRYQIILEASFSNQGDVTNIYTNDRKANPDVRIYTLKPDLFVVSRLFSPIDQPVLTSFNATVFRGHLEHPDGKPIDGLDPTKVQIKKVIYAKKFDPAAEKISKLTYILFGSGSEFYLAHMISKPADFDQILSVTVKDHQVTPEELDRGIVVTFERSNTASQRLEQGQEAQQGRAEFLSPTGQAPFSAQIQAGTEYYFEEGELMMPATFDQTDEERKA